MKNIEESLQKWESGTLAASLKSSSERRPAFTTPSEIELKRLYTPLDAPQDGYVEKSGFPGEHPFTRGVQPTMYRGRFWTMRQYAGFGTAEESNRRYRYMLSIGQTGLSVAFDLPTQMGRDSDNALARGEVGKCGVAIDSIEDMAVLFDSIPLQDVSTSMTINSTAMILLAMYAAVGERQSVRPEALRGTIQNDVLKEYIARGTYIYPIEPSLRITTDIFAWCSRRLPQFNTISISGYHVREAGSTAVQEVAFTLANAVTYVEAALRAGIKLEAFAPRLSFFFNAHNNLLEEVAKFRAARRLWAAIMRERFKAADPRCCTLRFHTQTAGCTLTAQQPMNNVVRVTIQALAAALGGTQSLHTNSFDEALALPTEESATIALRTQQIVACESGIADTVDPLAGSYAVEALTDRIEDGARAYMKKIDEMGGMVKAIEDGFPQREIHEAAYRYQRQVEDKKRVIVGVNEFRGGAPAATPILKIDPATEQMQVERLGKLKKDRNNEAVARSLDDIRSAAKGSENLFPRVIDAVKAMATIGEISDAMRDVFGEYRERTGI